MPDFDDVSGTNPMRKGKEKKGHDAEKELSVSAKASYCSTCRLVSMASAILVVIAVVLGIVLAVGGGNGDDVGAQTLSLAAADLADACPGVGKNAAQSGQYTHIVQITYVFEGDAPNCSHADAINAATASVTGASEDTMVLTIIEEGVGARALAPVGRHVRVLRGRRGRV